MFQSPVGLCRQETAEDGTAVFSWQTERIQSMEQMLGLLDVVKAAMLCLRYPERDLFAVRLALEEAIINAVKHGHRGDWSKPVLVRYHIGMDRVLAEVEDQGVDFDPGAVPDPLADENLERSTGRGLLLMRHYVNWLRYNPRGNCLTLCKYRLVE